MVHKTGVIRSVTYGALMGLYGLVSVYLVVSWLPPGYGPVVPIGALIIAVLFQWPSWFDGHAALRWPRRLLGRMLFVLGSVPAGALAALLFVLVVPYSEWQDDVHTQSLARAGKSAHEIEATVRQHHDPPQVFLAQGAVVTLIPGLIGAIITTAAGGVFRKPTAPPPGRSIDMA